MKLLLLFLGFFVTGAALTQTYYPAQELTMVGKVMDTPAPFHRIDTLRYPDIPAVVKDKGIASAGLAISFRSNSNAIYAKWCTNSQYSIPNMTSIAYRGVDLYIKKDGAWQYAGVGMSQNGGNCNSAKLVDHLGQEEREFLLYLPLYSETQSLEIGVDEGASMKAGAQPFGKKVLVYGSSIVQGASASRPGLAYPAILSRQTGLDFLNLGMSGVAKMEREVADLVAEQEADVYLLDCIPNSSPEQVTERTGYLIRRIRELHPDAPIILMQSVIRESGYFDREIGERVRKQNENAYREFTNLQQEGVKNLHFIPAEELLGDDHEGTADGTHPNDLGFDRMVRLIKPVVLSVLE